MSKKSREQILNDCTYAVACCIDHYYDSSFNATGLQKIRDALSQILPPHGSGWIYDEEIAEHQTEWIEFRDRIIWPAAWNSDIWPKELDDLV